MNSVVKYSAALACTAVFGIAVAGLHSEGDDLPKGKPGDGHCTYMLQNLMMDSQVKTCQQPANAEGCAALGSTDDNSDAAHAEGECPMDGALAVCDTGDNKYVYYEDNDQLGGLEIGCGFQGGDWITP
jgi:hypothetical protein